VFIGVHSWLINGKIMNMQRLIASCFGLGRLPIAPGTWGSLPPVAIFALLCMGDAGVTETNVLMIGLALIGSIACVRFAPASIAATGSSDPREVVMDEFAGQSLAFVGIAMILPSQMCVAAALGFLLFRLFDILKPWPIYKLESLPGGWGILADDLLAGVYAAIIFQICALTGLIAFLSKWI
jgi:phosphatidylglycerophosphatase A